MQSMQGKIFAASALLILFLFSLSSVAQAEIYACDINGVEKAVFYTNETVYVTGNITYADNTSTLYVMPNNDSWVNHTQLLNSTLTKSVTSNSTGGIAPTAVWTSPRIGSYDFVLDINGNSSYDAGIDFIDNATAVGFEVKQAPIPELNLSLGPNTTTSHTIDAADTNPVIMMQFKATAGSYEDVSLTVFGIFAEGTGNDEFVVAKFFEDNNANGIVDSNDGLIGFGQYPFDDGFKEITLSPTQTIAANTSKYYLVTYTFLGSNRSAPGKTFSCSISTATAQGVTSKTGVSVKGTPVKSAIITIAGATTTTTTTQTTTTTSSTTTTTEFTETTTTTEETTTTTEAPPFALDTTTLVIIAVVIVVIVAAVVYFLKFRSQPTSGGYEYDALKRKWAK